MYKGMEIRESTAYLRNFTECDTARKGWKVKKRAEVGEMNKAQIVKGFGKLVRPRSAVASFSLRLLMLRLCSYSSRLNRSWVST